MNNVCAFKPCTLLELSIKNIFGVSCEESISRLRQLSTKEIIEAAVLVRTPKMILTKYESVLNFESNNMHQFFYEDFGKLSESDYKRLINYDELRALSECSRIIGKFIDKHGDNFSKNLPIDDEHWKSHPMCQVIYNKEGTDVSKSYYEKFCERRCEILSLPELTSKRCKHSKTKRSASPEPSMKKFSCYYDPMRFLSKNYLDHERDYPFGIILAETQTRAAILMESLDDTMSILKRNSRYLQKPFHTIVMASSLQLRHSIMSLKKSLSERSRTYRMIGKFAGFFYKELGSKERELQLVESLAVVACVRAIDSNVRAIKEKIIPLLERSNFVQLEDLVEMFRNKISTGKIRRDEVNSLKLSLEKTSHFLGKKCRAIMAIKRSRIEQLLKKIDLKDQHSSNKVFLEPVFINGINESVEKMRKEIAEMETTIKALPKITTKNKN